MNELSPIGVLGFWVQADAVGKAAALLLLLMSMATWYLIVSKTLQLWRTRRQAEPGLQAFWQAPELEQALVQLRDVAAQSPFYEVAAAGAGARSLRDRRGSLDASLDASELVARALRRAVQRASARLDAGLSVLASVGATAPFVGLFGTVWGIYHALIGIGFTGQATIDKVAGPVGEALIMTAFGIAVAVPAVLAYNFLLRAHRVVAAELDGFAHDLHVYLTTSVRSEQPAQALDPAAGGRRRA